MSVFVVRVPFAFIQHRGILVTLVSVFVRNFYNRRGRRHWGRVGVCECSSSGSNTRNQGKQQNIKDNDNNDNGDDETHEHPV